MSSTISISFLAPGLPRSAPHTEPHWGEVPARNEAFGAEGPPARCAGGAAPGRPGDVATRDALSDRPVTSPRTAPGRRRPGGNWSSPTALTDAPDIPGSLGTGAIAKGISLCLCVHLVKCARAY